MNKLQQLISESTIIDERCKQCPNLIIPWVAWHDMFNRPKNIRYGTCRLSPTDYVGTDLNYRGICGECDPDNCEVNRS